MADAQPQQINLPSLALILVLSGLVIRYLFFSPPSSSSGGGASSSSSSSTTRSGRAGGAGAADPAAVARAREAAVERIQQMFPQVERRAVLWDLQRGGGSVAGTAERILAGRLESPPITFQPPPPPGSGNTNGNAAAATRAAAGPAHPDLITRYKLQNKLSAEDNDSKDNSGSAESGGKTGKAWSADRDERQTLLQKRRDQMILEARRKMEAKIAAEKAAGGK